MLALIRRSPTLMLAGLAGVGPLAAQDSTSARRDTTRATRLETLEVRITRGAEARLRVPAPISVADSAAFRGGQLQNGLDEALGRLPGVVLFNRFNPSLDQRLVIRGAGARANFGIRGIKVLLDGIPQTLPDGQSQLTNIDLGTIERAEVMSGPASALYGNAGGGVVLLTSARPGGPFETRVRALGGSAGTSRVSARVGGQAGAWTTAATFARFASDGFRQQSGSLANQWSIAANRILSPQWLLRLRYYGAANPRARNPGALNLTELAANRDSATANNILRGTDKDVSQHQLGATISRADDRGNTLEATVFGLIRNLENPLATAPPGTTGPTVGTWSGIDRVAGGARVTGQRQLSSRARLGFGADIQTMRDDRINRRSVRGVPSDTIVADQRETATELGPFASLHLEPTDRLTILAVGRYDQVRFRVRDHYLTDGVDQSGQKSMSAASGSLGLNWRLAADIAAYASVSTAFETPTTTELVNQANATVGFNDALGPQRTRNVEVGARSTGPVTASLALYRAWVTDALVQAREQDGRAFFENAGRLVIRGVEAGISWHPVRRTALTLSYSHTDARFDRYLIRNGATTDTANGRQVPGVPRHVFRGIASASVGPIGIEWDQQIVSRYFADDRNTLAAPGWGAGVTSLRIRWDRAGGSPAAVAPFIGVNNLWDRRYVSAVTVNGFGGRVFEPAPGRWGYAGIEARLGGRRGGGRMGG